MERRLISGTGIYEPIVGYSRAVVAGDRVHVSGTAANPPDGSPPPEDIYDQTLLCLELVGTALEQAGTSLEHVVRTRVYLTDADDFDGFARAHAKVFGDVRPANTTVLAGAVRSPRGRSRSRSRRSCRERPKQAFPSSITGNGSEPAGSVIDHKFGTGDPYTLGVEEEYQLLDGDGFELVQHIDTMLAAVSGHELEARINPELMQSVLEITTPVCRTAGDIERELVTLRSYVTGIAREKGLRVGSAGTHPFSLFERQRITAKDRYRALIDQMQYIARRELIFGMHVHVAVDDPEKAIQVVNGLLPHLAPLLALSASSPFWRGEPTGLASSRQMVFSAFPRSGPASALPRLLGLRRGRRPARALRLHRRLHAHLVGHPPAPAPRNDRDPHLRRGDASRGRRRDRGLLPGAREAALRAARGRRTRSRRTTASSRARTSGSPRATASRRR